MVKHYHFIGIGGIGMGAIASLLLAKGAIVSGSDVRLNGVTEKLSNEGARIYPIGHEAGNINGAQCVVYSSAIGDSNPELKAARDKGMPMLKRAELLADLMKETRAITVAGAHGKTTTSSMIAHVLIQAGLHPTTAIGGIVDHHARLGSGDFFVAEVDESDGSFLKFNPEYSVITNIDLEHTDYYPDWDHIIEAYQTFIARTKEGGMIIACGDDQRLQGLLKESSVDYCTYGLGDDNDISAARIMYDGFQCFFECFLNGKILGRVNLSVSGQHNVLNALACIALGLKLSIDFDKIRSGLQNYSQVQRRFQLIGRPNDIYIVDDYAHHPTEIMHTLSTALSIKQKRLIAVVQPHRYSRLNAFMEQFAESLVNSDHVIVTDVYAAGEKPIPQVSPQKLCDRIQSKGKTLVEYIEREQLVDHLTELAEPGDFVLILGAGDITQAARELCESLRGSV